MSKFLVTVDETQYWRYQYLVEAETPEKAKEIGVKKHFDGFQSWDNELMESETTDSFVREIENESSN